MLTLTATLLSDMFLTIIISFSLSFNLTSFQVISVRLDCIGKSPGLYDVLGTEEAAKGLATDNEVTAATDTFDPPVEAADDEDKGVSEAGEILYPGALAAKSFSLEIPVATA